MTFLLQGGISKTNCEMTHLFHFDRVTDLQIAPILCVKRYFLFHITQFTYFLCWWQTQLVLTLFISMQCINGKTKIKYRMRAIISHIFSPLFRDNFFVFKYVFLENSALKYGQYSSLVCNPGTGYNGPHTAIIFLKTLKAQSL